MTSPVGAFVFALAGKADADNIIPVVWELSRDGTKCVVVITDEAVFWSQQDAFCERTRRDSSPCNGEKVSPTTRLDRFGVSFDGGPPTTTPSCSSRRVNSG